MLSIFYRFFQKILFAYVDLSIKLVTWFRPSKRGELEGKLYALISNKTFKVETEKSPLYFYYTNSLTYWRAESFYVKEPETIEWINGFSQGACVWDIGANIGLYSVYAATMRDCSVYAFEPSVFNLELLAKNISINNLTDKIIIFSLPLSSTIKEAEFKMSAIEHGEACSTFGESYGFDGQLFEDVFKYRTVSFPCDLLMQTGAVPSPNYIKIDVDGIEHLILYGMSDVLTSPSLKSILVETNEAFSEQEKGIAVLLSGAGFELREKKHADFFENSKFSSSYNCIWTR